MTLEELRDRICDDQISEDEVMAALREPLAKTDAFRPFKAETGAHLGEYLLQLAQVGAIQNPRKGEGSIDGRHNKSHGVIVMTLRQKSQIWMKDTDQRPPSSEYAPYEAFWEGFVDYRHGLHRNPYAFFAPAPPSRT